MSNIAVVYWSGTGNTEAMAEGVAKGITEAGGNAEMISADNFSEDMINNYEAIAFGCPSMGIDALEEDVFEPMFDKCKSQLNGKKICLFGSYGWGSGEWMEAWEEECKQCGANLICDSVICNYEPDDTGIKECVDMGKALV